MKFQCVNNEGVENHLNLMQIYKAHKIAHLAGAMLGIKKESSGSSEPIWFIASRFIKVEEENHESAMRG